MFEFLMITLFLIAWYIVGERFVNSKIQTPSVKALIETGPIGFIVYLLRKKEG